MHELSLYNLELNRLSLSHKACAKSCFVCYPNSSMEDTDRFLGSSPNMSYNLNSLKGVIWRIFYGTTIGVIRRDTRSLDYSSYGTRSFSP